MLSYAIWERGNAWAGGAVGLEEGEESKWAEAVGGREGR